ncbi:MAG: hypothetical protein CBE07_001485 [Pelagibacteraceae bacterium TMED247]|nr:MAG: hypothetical protein CBE07_001485 [Pelagibacteraceae bacterium TMED247]
MDVAIRSSNTSKINTLGTKLFLFLLFTSPVSYFLKKNLIIGCRAVYFLNKVINTSPIICEIKNRFALTIITWKKVALDSKEAIYKVIIWRLGLSLPIGFTITYTFFGGIYRSFTFIIIISIIMTLVNFLYEKNWKKIWKKISKEKKE